MSGFLDNCVSFGGATLSTRSDYRQMLIEFFDTVMTSRTLGAEDRCVACKLAEVMLLNLRGNMDEVNHELIIDRWTQRSFCSQGCTQGIPPIVERCMPFIGSKLTDKDDDFVVTNSLFLHSLNVLITAMLYNPALTLAILDRHDWTQAFFAQWFKNLPKLTRVHDKKISIEAICALFEWLAQNPQAPLAQNAGQLIVGALQIFKDLPEALNSELFGEMISEKTHGGP